MLFIGQFRTGGDVNAPLQALIFDSYFDAYKGGAIAYVVMDGNIKPGMKLKMMATDKTFEVTDVGIFKPSLINIDELGPGQVGFVAGSIKNVKDVRVGDTTSLHNPAQNQLPGYRKMNPMVYCGLYPVDSADYDVQRCARKVTIK